MVPSRSVTGTCLRRGWDRRKLVAAAAVAGLLVLLQLAAGSAGAEEKQDPAQSFRTLRDQGVHYYKRSLYGQALTFLARAAATDAGHNDFRTQLFLARSAYQELVLEQSFPAARRALEIAKAADDEDSLKQAAALIEELEGSFGGVSFRQDPDQKTTLKETYIFLKDTGGLINVRKKQVFDKIRQRFLTTRVELPITLYLPFGKYSANGAPFEVKKGELAEAKLFMYLDEPGGISWWWYAGAAVLVAGGTAAALLLLAGEEEQTQAARFEPMPFYRAEQ